MRIHELAKILAVSSTQLIKDFKRIRVQVKNHMSAVEDKHVRRIMKTYEKRRAEAARKAEDERKRKEAEELKKREAEERKRKELEERRQREAEEQRRKEIEERRRLEAEERKRRAELLAQRKARAEARKKQRAAPAKRAESQRPAPARAREKPQQAPSPQAPEQAEKPPEPLTAPEPVPLVVPKIEVMSFKDMRRDRSSRKRSGPKREGKRVRPSKVIKVDDLDVSRHPPKADDHEKKIRPSFFVQPSSTAVKEPPQTKAPVKPPTVTIRGDITVGQLAEKLNVPASDIISKCLEMGEIITINQVMDPDLCTLVVSDLGFELEIIPESDEHDVEQFLPKDLPGSLKGRPPVVTIMGHVDHGKTTLLDNIRKSDVVGGEFGGITQHIGAYHVTTPSGDIVFLDTPGHEAFTSMRARGASVTDIVVLVVAADDGVMPQTIEAINHARAANVPIIVAINKIDLPNANPDRVRQALLQYELVPEELGGQTIFVEISAKKGIGISRLLEMILLHAEMLELRANPDRPAAGRIIESHIDPLRGAVATVLVQNGTLRASDIFLTGKQYGKVRAMNDERMQPVREAAPSRPVEIIGLTGPAEVGELFLVLPEERIARQIANVRSSRRRAKRLRQTPMIALENLHEYVEQGKIKDLNLILKCDVQGSMEAILQSLEKLSGAEVRINVIHAAVGGINESDVNLAIASDAIIIGFNVRPEFTAGVLAEREGVDIKIYRVIYELINDIKKALTGMLEQKYREVFKGRAEVRQVFRVSKVGNVAGCFVSDGEITDNARARVIRDSTIVYEGSIASLRRIKDDVKRVTAGLECGIALANFNDIKENDIIEAYVLEEIPRALE
jgi:translation initiation factor IF-2